MATILRELQRLRSLKFVDIHAEGSLTGDVVCASPRIEDGGYFKGSIAIHERSDKPEELEAL